MADVFFSQPLVLVGGFRADGLSLLDFDPQPNGRSLDSVSYADPPKHREIHQPGQPQPGQRKRKPEQSKGRTTADTG